MLLHTAAYLGFLAAVGAAYWLLPTSVGRKWLLFVSSLLFYCTFDVRFPVLLLGMASACHLLGRAMGTRPGRPLYMWLAVALTLGVLGVFKYNGFFLDSVGAVLAMAGVERTPPALGLLLPIGISFYSFQALGYLADVYRGMIQPSRSWLDVSLTLAFFPKLIAGPIVRPAELLERLSQSLERPSPDTLRQGLTLLLLGLFKKIVIADSLCAIGDAAFRAASMENSAGFPAPLYWQGFYLYAFHIYADFSGYTDIARASALIFNIRLPDNFSRPYARPTIAAFWNAWHMTLTSWFREYLYFPLTRRLLRSTRRRLPLLVQSVSTVATMVLIGLWHGAAWTFVLWGAWHGVLLLLERLLRWQPHGRAQSAMATLITFHLVAVGWVLFRSEDVNIALRFISGAFSLEGTRWIVEYLPAPFLAGALVLVTDKVHPAQAEGHVAHRSALYQVLAVAAVFTLGLLALLGQIRGAEVRPFIYGQF